MRVTESGHSLVNHRCFPTPSLFHVSLNINEHPRESWHGLLRLQKALILIPVIESEEEGGGGGKKEGRKEGRKEGGKEGRKEGRKEGIEKNPFINLVPISK